MAGDDRMGVVAADRQARAIQMPGAKGQLLVSGAMVDGKIH